MTAAHTEFTGLITSQNKFTSTSRRIAGEPCIHADHYRDDLGYRHGPTNACVECLKRIDAPVLSFDYSGLRHEAMLRAYQFWNKVDIKGWDDCWRYGDGKPVKNLGYVWPRPLLASDYKVHVTRVAIWLSWGDFGMLGTVSRCGERRCCNPLHNLPLGMDEAMLMQISKETLDAELERLKNDLEEHRQNPKSNKPKIRSRHRFDPVGRSHKVIEEIDEHKSNQMMSPSSAKFASAYSKVMSDLSDKADKIKKRI